MSKDELVNVSSGPADRILAVGLTFCAADQFTPAIIDSDVPIGAALLAFRMKFSRTPGREIRVFATG